ncbi:hypothetical protein CH252_04910 [Rhodococcus sp. 06-1477-1B]|nr:hypothetical protein CH252_04910 [Rhodococcus sp. 06-1477-1B]
MTDINIFLNVKVPGSALGQVAALTGLPDSLAGEEATVWVQTMVASTQIGDSFPVEKWFNNVPGQATDLATDIEDVLAFCNAVGDSNPDVVEDEHKALFVKLMELATAVEGNAHFNIVLDY